MMNTRVVATQYGGPDSLEVVEEPLRPLQRDEVRVRVQSAGVALADVMRREGKYPVLPPVPFTPGYDAVGIVDELGEEVRHVRKGEKVAVFYHGVGGYAAYVYAKPAELYPVPAGIDSSLAVAVILNYVTAYQMLHRIANVSDRRIDILNRHIDDLDRRMKQLEAVKEIALEKSEFYSRMLDERESKD